MNEETNAAEALQKEPEKKAEKSQKLAVIRIKGPSKIGFNKEDTLKMMGLHRRNYCVVIPKNPSMLGMIRKVERCVAWGEIDDSTLKELTSKRGEKTVKDGKETLKPFFRLSPPRGGFERKGTKVPFSKGGAFGYRAEKINNLIRRML